MTDRNLAADLEAAFAAANAAPLLLLEMQFDSGTVRVTNLGHSISWGGYTWLGAGYVGRIDRVTESEGTQANRLRAVLTGVQPALVSVAMTEQYQGRVARLWIAAIGGGALKTPLLGFAGRMDNMEIELGGTAEIAVNIESRLADFERARVGRYNNADQRARYPNSRGFEYVEQLVERNLFWGNPSPPAQTPLGS